MKVFLKGKTLAVDFVTVGLYNSLAGKMMFDSSLVLEGVIKEIEYKVDLNLYELTKLVKEEFHDKQWYMFKFKRGLL